MQLNRGARKLLYRIFIVGVGLLLTYQGISFFKTSGKNSTAANKLSTAINLGLEASRIQQSSAYSLETWQQSQTKLHKAIGLLENIPSETNVFNQAQIKIESYHASLADINKRIAVEDKAAADFEYGKKLGEEAYQLSKTNSDSQFNLELIQEKLNNSINLLAGIPSETAISKEAKSILFYYRKNYETASKNLNALIEVLSQEAQPDSPAISASVHSEPQNGLSIDEETETSSTSSSTNIYSTSNSSNDDMSAWTMTTARTNVKQYIRELMAPIQVELKAPFFGGSFEEVKPGVYSVPYVAKWTQGGTRMEQWVYVFVDRDGNTLGHST